MGTRRSSARWHSTGSRRPSYEEGSATSRSAGGRSAIVPDNGDTNDKKAGNTSSNVEFDLHVPVTGSYQLIGEVVAPSTSSDSFWVQVDGQPRDGTVWDLPEGPGIRQAQFGPLTLGAGPHTVVLSMREDGAGVATLALRRVLPSTGLTFAAPATADDPEGQPVDRVFGASDPDGGTLSFTALSLPDGLHLDGRTGRITGSPTAAGTRTARLLVTDGSEQRQLSVLWTISATNVAPQVADPGDQLDVVDAPLSLDLAVTDTDGDPVTVTVEGLPDGLVQDPAGTISGKPSALGSWNVHVHATDDHGHTTTRAFSWEVIRPPFTCMVDRASRTLHWTNQAASTYTIRHTSEGPETFVKQVSALELAIKKLYGTYRVSYSIGGVRRDASCDGPALPPSRFACSLDVPSSTVAWTDQGGSSYTVKKVVDSSTSTAVGTTAGLSLHVRDTAATYSVTYADAGTKVTTTCTS